MTTFLSAPTIPVRLLSSVAIIGQDNEPIYLQGDLCEVHVVNAGVCPHGRLAAQVQGRQGD
jgi:hypothetical protein